MTWQEAVSAYYQTHPTLNDQNRRWLSTKVLMDAPLIEEMTREQILATFSNKGEMNHARLMRTLVWQCLGLILCGQEEPLKGNLRSFDYRFTKPIYGRNELYKVVSDKDRRYQEFLASLDSDELRRGETVKQSYISNLCEDIFQEYVEQKVFRYQGAFDVRDANAGKCRLGEGRASLIFFTEKEGLEDYCVRYHDEYRISTMMSRGQPSLVSAEFFGDELRAKKIKRVALAALVDWDPAGFSIAATYRRNFENLGFEVKNFQLLTRLDLFTEHALKTKSYALDGQKSQVKKWFELTGGIHGECRGIHVNHARENRVNGVFKDWYQDQVD